MNKNVNKLVGTLAIDLGSTTTVVAFQAENTSSIKLLDLGPINRTAGEIPSLVWKSNDKIPCFLFGQAIHQLPQEQKIAPNLISDFKRWIGAPKDKVPKNFVLTPQEAGELLIKEIWERLPTEIEIKKLVLSAPVETYREYRQWIHDACIDLKVKEIALVDEPTAAAIGANQPGGSKILVVDIGGSTIDMSMVQLEGGEGQSEPIAQLIRFNGEDLEGKSHQVFRGAKVLGKAGLRLGGRDFDRWILKHLYPDIIQNDLLLDTAEKLKCRLSDIKITDTQKLTETVSLNQDSNDFINLKLTKLEFENLLKQKGLFNSLSKLLERTLARGRSKGCDLEDLTGVVLVGGGSRIPVLKEWLLNQLGRKKLITPPPIEAVVTGALKLTPGVMIRDILSKGTALRFWDQKSNQHLWHPLFLPGQPWPTTKPLELLISPSKQNQTEIELKLADQNTDELQEVIYIDGIPTIKSLERSSIQKISPWKITPLIIQLDPPGEKGKDCLKLKFSIDSLCQLTIEVIDIRSESKIVEKIIGLIN